MALSSFDIVSGYDKAEINNIFLQTNKEISGRYDFKNTSCALDWLENHKGFKLTADNEWQIDTIIEIIRKKIASRGLSQKIIDVTKDIVLTNLKATKEIPIKESLEKEDITKITKLLKKDYPKIKLAPAGDSLRVSSSSRDELQQIINFLNNQPLDFAISYNNYK